MDGNGLYDARFEHDGCGVGFVARLQGGPDRGVLEMALEALGRLEHRGALAADGKSGDGAGVMTGIPEALFRAELGRLGYALADGERLGVGMVFMPRSTSDAATLEGAVRGRGVRVLGWREVPVDVGALGATARGSLPAIRQLLVASDLPERVFERRLYLARKAFERSDHEGYVCSFSCRTLVYKALCAGQQLPAFYADLSDPRYRTVFAVYHQRYSTNTLPSWRLAQPFRLSAHNGEINTLWGNRSWLQARERELPSGVRPLFDAAGSDSASLDEVLELLTRHRRDVVRSLAMLLVPAWEESSAMDPQLRAFHRYHLPLMEPWDGPAAVAFSDGRFVGAALDRNGLRPCRYKRTRDGLVVAGSEVGVVDLDPADVVVKGRLAPGAMIVVDLRAARVMEDAEVRTRLAAALPYREWLGARSVARRQRSEARVPADLQRLRALFGYTREEVRLVLSPMMEDGKEAVWSMGDDTPIPPLGRAPRSLYAFFRQRFAQVTNPAIDPLRETSVMSLRTWLGPRPPLLVDAPQQTMFELASPVLTRERLAWLREQRDLPAVTLELWFRPGRERLEDVLEELCRRAAVAVRSGAAVLVLSDAGVGPNRAPVPAALAVSAVHQHLSDCGLRTRSALVVESGDCWDVHHLAVLVGYGAGAVCPWVALATARESGGAAAERLLVSALEKGLRKIMSKMGISTVASYRGARLFEVLGLNDAVVDRCFAGSPNPVGGFGFGEIEEVLRARYDSAYAAVADGKKRKLPDFGWIRYRRGDEKAHHAWAPPVVRALQRAVGSSGEGQGPEPEAWGEFESAASEFPGNLRDLLDVVAAGPTLPLEAVEPAESIVRRFITSPMSLGALSPEAHATLAIAMNRLGARSNTGEGGEDPDRYEPLPNGDRADSKVKQVASGRFGVTAEYIARAEELEIKIAQGSKPGEGGQLPGHKVTDLIARLRHAQTGISLISPPPHHDIYSIEDLAQLIYDLKRCNPRARVGVKLVSEAGVGTIAAGVAKAYADYVFVCGHSGGTGASPLSSIKYAGSPWELGLAETQQVLLRNGLRDRVRIRVDGGLMTGRDVVIAALLGAEEFGFGTAPLVALGCDMARQCHLNTCPTGVATQRADLRAKFRGRPDHVVRYFLQIAESVRGLLAALGLRDLDQAVGRVDLLRQVHVFAGLDLSRMLVEPGGPGRRCASARNDRPEREEPLDERFVAPALESLDAGRPYHASARIRNRDRSIGARLAGALALRDDRERLHPGAVELRFHGSAGQSFGAFCGRGLRLILDGEANDYVAKGLSGGEIVLRPDGAARAASRDHVILGNVALYGATAGRLFAAGRAGERFAVRNSGAIAVVEGLGDHGCEYMTGGCVLVLGRTGWNFGAGMTGGVAYVYDENETFPARVNPGVVTWERAVHDDAAAIRTLLEEHRLATGSVWAETLLTRWERTIRRFWKVRPRGRRAEVSAVRADGQMVKNS